MHKFSYKDKSHIRHFLIIYFSRQNIYCMYFYLFFICNMFFLLPEVSYCACAGVPKRSILKTLKRFFNRRDLSFVGYRSGYHFPVYLLHSTIPFNFYQVSVYYTQCLCVALIFFVFCLIRACSQHNVQHYRVPRAV